MAENAKIEELLEAILGQLSNQTNATYNGKDSKYFTGEYTRGGYGKTYADVRQMREQHKLEKEKKRLLKELQKELQNTGQASDELKERLKALGTNVDELTESEEALTKAISDAEESASKTNLVNRLSTINGITERIKGNLKSIDQKIYAFAKPWAEANAAASKYAKTIGLTEAGLDSLQKYTTRNVVKGYIGIDFNVSTPELIEMQQNYSNAIGRNIMAGDMENQKAISAMHAVMQGREMELAVAFENFGLNLERTGDHAGKMFSEASKAGLSFTKYSDNVAKNIKIAQNYTFKNGLRGLENMAKKATALKIDMGQVAAFADKVNSVEGAIDVASKLQVLGGPFASFADPLGMLSESLLDMEGLTDRITNMIGGLGNFNKKTGEVEVSAFNKQRIKAAAEAMGMSYDNLMESVNAQTKRRIIEGQINASPNARGLNEDMKELLKNSASFNKEGKAGVSINGEFKTLDKITNEDYKELVKETQTESEDIKDIAKHVRSLDEKRSGLGKQYDANKAQMTGWLGKAMGKVTDFVGHQNWMLKGGVIIEGIGTIIGILGNIQNIISSFGSFGGGGIGGGGGGGTGVVGKVGNYIAGGYVGRKGYKFLKNAFFKGGEKKLISSAGKRYVLKNGVLYNAEGKALHGAIEKTVLKSAKPDTLWTRTSMFFKKAERWGAKSASRIGKWFSKAGTKVNGLFSKIGTKTSGWLSKATAKTTGLFSKTGAQFSKWYAKTGSKIEGLVTKSTGKLSGWVGKNFPKLGEYIGKYGGKVGKNAGKFFGPGGIASLAGMGIDIWTDAEVEKGNWKKGGWKQYAGKIGGGALDWGGFGLSVGGPVGAAVGAALGAINGGLQAHKGTLENYTDDILKARGMDGLKGDNYNYFQTARILEAIGGRRKLNERTRRRMIENGDEEILKLIDATPTLSFREQLKQEWEGIKSLKFDDLLNDFREHPKEKRFNESKQIIPLPPGGIKPPELLPKPETGLNPDVISMNERAKREKEKSISSAEKLRQKYEEFLTKPLGGNFVMNLSGTIKLAGANGKTVDLTKELLNDDSFKKQLAMSIKDHINYSLDGGNFPQRGMSV